MSRNEYSSTIENITESVYAAGFVKSKNQYEAYAIVSGVIKETYVAEGQLVKKGRPLLKLHNETSNLNLRNAELARNKQVFNPIVTNSKNRSWPSA